MSTLTPSEEAQLAQTVEMFEVITQSQPQDYQSLEILKEAYSKLGRQKDVIATSKRIAEAYVAELARALRGGVDLGQTEIIALSELGITDADQTATRVIEWSPSLSRLYSRVCPSPHPAD